MLRELNINEMEAVSGGGSAMGGMYDKDAHDGPGGLYGPGGQLESEFAALETMTMARFGMTGMEFMSSSSSNFSVEIGSGDVRISAYPIKVEADLITIEFNLWDHMADTPSYEGMQEIKRLWETRTRSFPDGGGECTLPC